MPAHRFTLERSSPRAGGDRSHVADPIEVPSNRLYRILAGKRNVTADTALLLRRHLDHVGRFPD
jgi:plasmid maintenance system antidote protein VapI